MTYIRYITPKNNTFDVSLSAQIEIGFKTPMLKDSLLDESLIQLSTGGQIVPLEREVKGQVLTLAPNSLLAPSTYYTLEVKAGPEGILDFMGKPSTSGAIIRFVTEEKIEEEETPEPPIEEPEEPSDPEEPVEEPKEPDNPIEDDFNSGIIESGIYLKKAYPENGRVITSDKPIVLIFSEELEPGDVQDSVKMTHLGLEEDVEIPVLNIRKKRSERHVITPVSPLEEGEDYELVIQAGLSSGALVLEENITLRYKANWNHMYATIEDVRLLLGDFGDALTDEDIARLIHNQSKSIHQLMQGMEVYVPEEWVNQFPYAAGQYVLYKVAYQSMVGQTVASASGMRKDVELGDFRTSSSQNTSSTIKDLLAILESEIDKWWRRLNGEIVDEVGDELRPNFIRTAGSALRGETDNPNPEFTTRVPFRELGG